QMPAANSNLRLRPRLVQGEILSDDDGRLFEKVGHRIRPLQRLFSGPRGEVLELPVEAQSKNHAAAPSPPLQSFDAEASKAEARHADDRAEATPERRRPPQRPFRRSQQHPMRAAQQAPTSAPHRQMRKDEANGQQRSQAPGPAAGHHNTIQRNDVQQQPPAATGVAANGLKTAIPDQWIKHVEFQISHEEAIYDMQAAASFGNSLLAFVRNLTGWFGHPQAWRKRQGLPGGQRPA